MSERVLIDTPGGAMPAHLWRPASGSGPGLLLLQEIFGVSAYIRARAQDLADLGYVVLAPELYWRVGEASVEEGPEALEQAFALVQRLDWDEAVRDSVAALEWLRQESSVSGGAGVIGFCFGGGVAFNVAALTETDVLVSYYGSAIPGLLDLAPQVTAPSQYHFGLADSYISWADLDRVRDAVSTRGDVVVETYEGADHAFDNPDFSLHHPGASAEAWGRTVDFLGTHLPVPA
jgi:carboxymethylenebutenolidase